MVGSARADGAAAQVQSGAPRLYPRPRRRAFRPRSDAARQPRRPAHARHRLRRRHSCRTAGAARRGGGRGRSLGQQYRGRASATPCSRGSRSITATPAPRRWRRPAKVSTWCSPWKWSSTSPMSALFVDVAAEMVKPGGLLFVATLNRTVKSFALAIVGAEYILRWLPRGTHQWDKFVTPNELEIAIEQSGLADRRRNRRDLQSARRPLAAFHRHGRELHGRRGECGVMLDALALGHLHRHRRVLPDLAQRDAARADRQSRHGRRDACAFSVRTFRSR